MQYKSDFTAAGYETTSFSAPPSFSQGYSMVMLVLPPRAQVFPYRVDET